MVALACGKSSTPAPPEAASTTSRPLPRRVDEAAPTSVANEARRVWLEPPVVVLGSGCADELDPLTYAIGEVLPAAAGVAVIHPQQFRDLE